MMLMPVLKPYLLSLALLLFSGNHPVTPDPGRSDIVTLQPETNLTNGPGPVFPQQQEHGISFSATLYSASLIAIELRGLEGSNPKQSGYFVAIWQGRQIEDLYRNQGMQLIDLNTKDGSFVFKLKEGLNNKEYIIGLGINDKDSTSFCSTMILPKDQPRFIPVADTNAFFASIRVLQTGTNSLIAAYRTPDFNLPETNKNWIALFRGHFTANTFKGINLIKKQAVNDNLNEGMIAINSIQGGLVSNEFYTLVYGMGNTPADSNSTESIIAATEFRIPESKD